jgi:hypothetical protein
MTLPNKILIKLSKASSSDEKRQREGEAELEGDELEADKGRDEHGIDDGETKGKDREGSDRLGFTVLRLRRDRSLAREGLVRGVFDRETGEYLLRTSITATVLGASSFLPFNVLILIGIVRSEWILLLKYRSKMGLKMRSILGERLSAIQSAIFCTIPNFALFPKKPLSLSLMRRDSRCLRNSGRGVDEVGLDGGEQEGVDGRAV